MYCIYDLLPTFEGFFLSPALTLFPYLSVTSVCSSPDFLRPGKRANLAEFREFSSSCLHSPEFFCQHYIPRNIAETTELPFSGPTLLHSFISPT